MGNAAASAAAQGGPQSTMAHRPKPTHVAPSWTQAPAQSAYPAEHQHLRPSTTSNQAPYNPNHRPSSPFEAGANTATTGQGQYAYGYQYGGQGQDQYGGQGQPPPHTGFNADVMEGQTPQPTGGYMENADPMYQREGGMSSMEVWDEKRDTTLMRVLSADEFLGRMDETDERIRTMSQAEERELHLARITELMGLRGHLQDELLRIEAMLVEDDPELECLRHFEGSHPRVVQVLREIKEKAKIIKAVPIPLEPETIVLSMPPASTTLSTANSTASSGTSMGTDSIGIGTQSGASTSEMGVQSEAFGRGQGQNIGTQSHGQGHELGVQVTDTGNGHQIKVDDKLTEDDLKEIHDKEEHTVAHNYAKRIITKEQLSKEAMDKLLSDHLLSMQALRRKQDMEKQRLQERLEQKKRERLLQRRAAQQDGEEDSDDIPGTSGNEGMGVTGATMSSAFVSNISFGPGGSAGDRPTSGRGIQGQGQVQKGGQSQSQGQAGSIQPVMVAASMSRPQSSRSVQGLENRDSGRGSASSKELDNESKENSSDDDDDDDEEDLSDSKYTYDDDFEEVEETLQDADDGPEREALKRTLSEDLWGSMRNKMTAEDFRAMLGTYRNQEEERQKLRAGEAERHKGSILARLAARKNKAKQGEGDGADSDGNGDTPNGIGADTSVGSAVKMADVAIDAQELKDKDSTFIQEFRRKNRHLSDGEIEELLKRHLADVEALRKQRNATKERLNEKLQSKLAKKKAKHGHSYVDIAEEEKDIEEVDMDLEQLDRELCTSLQNRRGELSEEELQEMLARYRRQQESLIRKRAADRDRLNQKLQQKLEAKKKKVPTATLR